MAQHIVAAFPPKDGIGRNSEGAFLRLKDGGLYFAYSQFKGGCNDDDASDIAFIRSYDEGETWSEPKVIFSAKQFEVKNIMSVSLLRMQNGDMGLIFGVRYGGIRYVIARSNDEGETFYDIRNCTLDDRPGYYVINNDRIIRLKSGRLVLPLTFHRGMYSSIKKTYCDFRGVACFLLSDDDGFTWREAQDTVCPPFTGSRTGFQENGVVEKENGVLWGYSRTDHMYQYEYFSMDEGEHWTSAQPSRFTSPDSPMKIKRDPHTGYLYSVWNPIPRYNGRQYTKISAGRTPIVWAVSKDDGVTWSDCNVIEGEEDHGYCYPAIFFTEDKSMLVAYCSGGPEDGANLVKLSIMKIEI